LEFLYLLDEKNILCRVNIREQNANGLPFDDGKKTSESYFIIKLLKYKVT